MYQRPGRGGIECMSLRIRQVAELTRVLLLRRSFGTKYEQKSRLSIRGETFEGSDLSLCVNRTSQMTSLGLCRTVLAGMWVSLGPPLFRWCSVEPAAPSGSISTLPKFLKQPRCDSSLCSNLTLNHSETRLSLDYSFLVGTWDSSGS